MNEDRPSTAKYLMKFREYYNSIPSPKYRHANLNTLKEKFQQLQDLKDDLGQDKAYRKLINAMSQIIAKLERYNNIGQHAQR